MYVYSVSTEESKELCGSRGGREEGTSQMRVPWDFAGKSRARGRRGEGERERKRGARERREGTGYWVG